MRSLFKKGSDDLYVGRDDSVLPIHDVKKNANNMNIWMRNMNFAFMVFDVMSHSNLLHIKNKEESHLCSGLYIVPTPIGNLRDITLRALDVLMAADIVLCEDSRVSGKLLKAYNLNKEKKITYNDHADNRVKARIMAALEQGQILALISDAGTPMISDPGYKLVRDCVDRGFYVTALPGANAVLPAIQLSAMPSDEFTFLGFLPSKDKGVRDAITKIEDRVETCVFYESPNRIEKTLKIMAEMIPNRPIAVVREISKLYEEALRGKASEILSIIADKPLKGEIAIVIGGALDEKIYEQDDIDALIIKKMNEGQSIKDFSAEIAKITGQKKKEIYNRALVVQNEL